MTENKVIPKLRFKEFHDDWQYRLLEEVSKITTGSTPPTSKKEYYGGNRLFVSPADIKDNRFVVSTKTTLTELGLKEGRVINRGSVLFVCIGSTIGKTAQINEECITNQQINALTANSYYSNDFIFSLLSFKANKIKRYAGVQAVPQINKTDFSKFKFYFPLLPEQLKIAEFLSSVDKKIQLLEKKKEQLELYKKGVMQKIFSREIRFKDENGNSYPDWEKKKLGDIGETYNGLTGKTKEDFGEGKPFIEYMQVFSSSKIDVSNFGYVNVTKDEKQNTTKYGDIFFTTSSETPTEVGFSSVLNDKIEEVYLNSFCFGYRPNSLLELLPEFSAYLFRCLPIRKQIIKLAQGSTRYNMSKVQLMKIEVGIPNNNEQKKIADFLTAIDKKIESTSTQIDKAKEFKKGLLQQMFV